MFLKSSWSFKCDCDPNQIDSRATHATSQKKFNCFKLLNADEGDVKRPSKTKTKQKTNTQTRRPQKKEMATSSTKRAKCQRPDASTCDATLRVYSTICRQLIPVPIPIPLPNANANANANANLPTSALPRHSRIDHVRILLMMTAETRKQQSNEQQLFRRKSPLLQINAPYPI